MATSPSEIRFTARTRIWDGKNLVADTERGDDVDWLVRSIMDGERDHLTLVHQPATAVQVEYV